MNFVFFNQSENCKENTMPLDKLEYASQINAD
jgi:hypothetical protein